MCFLKKIKHIFRTGGKNLYNFSGNIWEIIRDQAVTVGESKMTAFELSLLVVLVGVFFFYDHKSLTASTVRLVRCVHPSQHAARPWVTAAGAGAGAANSPGRWFCLALQSTAALC